MKRFMYSITLASVVLFSGCATSTSNINNKNATQSLKLENNKVYIYRPSSLIGSMVKPPMSIDDKVVGNSFSGSLYIVKLPNGEHKFSVYNTTYSKTAGLFGGALGAIIAGAKHQKTKEITFTTGSKPTCIKVTTTMSTSGEMDFKEVGCDTVLPYVDDLKIKNISI